MRLARLRSRSSRSVGSTDPPNPRLIPADPRSYNRSGLRVLQCPLEEVEVSELSVSYVRELPKAPLAPWEVLVSGLDSVESFGRKETGTFVTPGLHKQTYTITGSDGPELELVRTHGFTPESAGATHVFLQISWRGAAVSPHAGAHLAAVFHEMANRDLAVVETMQRCLDEDTTQRRYVNVKADRAALRARRIVQSMVEDERGL